MGIVRKQSFVSSIFMYIGVLVGALNVMVLFPHFFSKETFGLYSVFIDFATLFSVVITLGSIASFIKFYPIYDAHLKPKENDLPFWTILCTLLGAIIFVVFCVSFPEWIERKFGHNSQLFVDNFYLVIPLTLSFTALIVMEPFCWMIKKTIVSNFVKEVPFRLFTTILIVAYILKWITMEQFFHLFAFLYVPGCLIMLWVLIKDGHIKIVPKVSKVTRRLYNKILQFTAFHFSGMIINILPKTMDGILLAGIVGLSETATYTLSTNFIALMEMPQRSMIGIASALISEAWKDKNKVKIQELYHKTSLNLLIVGILVFGVLYPNMDNLVRFEGPNYALVKQIFLIGGIAKLIDMGMGMNQQIIGYSKYWRIDFFTSIAFVGLTVAVNYFFIHKWSTVGAAFGNALCLIGFNLLRFIYNWRLFKLQPFSSNTFWALLIGGIAIVPSLLLPYLGNMFIDAGIRALIFIILYAFGILYFNVSSDFSDMYRMFVNKLKKAG